MSKNTISWEDAARLIERLITDRIKIVALYASGDGLVRCKVSGFVIGLNNALGLCISTEFSAQPSTAISFFGVVGLSPTYADEAQILDGTGMGSAFFLLFFDCMRHTPSCNRLGLVFCSTQIGAGPAFSRNVAKVYHGCGGRAEMRAPTNFALAARTILEVLGFSRRSTIRQNLEGGRSSNLPGLGIDRNNRGADMGRLGCYWMGEQSNTESGFLSSLPKRELEGRADTHSASVLQDNPKVSSQSDEAAGRSRSGARRRENQAGNDGEETQSTNGRAVIMPKGVRIGPNENIRPRYHVPESGMVRFTLESDLPLQTYIVRPKGLEFFDEGSTTFKYYGGYPDARRKQSQTLRLPFEGTWHLLIINRDKEDTATVDYSIYYE